MNSGSGIQSPAPRFAKRKRTAWRPHQREPRRAGTPPTGATGPVARQNDAPTHLAAPYSGRVTYTASLPRSFPPASTT